MDARKLNKFTLCGGCAAKLPQGLLQDVLKSIPAFADERLLVGFDSSDDGAVYQLSDELAVIHTTDFFPPMVDDPYLFGKIAAANALSDVYAMGGQCAVYPGGAAIGGGVFDHRRRGEESDVFRGQGGTPGS